MKASINNIISECKTRFTITNGKRIKKLIDKIINCRTREGFYSISFENNYYVYEVLDEVLSEIIAYKKTLGKLNDIYEKTKKSPRVYDLSEIVEDLEENDIISFNVRASKIVHTSGDTKMVLDQLKMIYKEFAIYIGLWKYAIKESMGEAYTKGLNEDFQEYNSSIIKIYEYNKNFIATIDNFLKFINNSLDKIEKSK